MMAGDKKDCTRQHLNTMAGRDICFAARPAERPVVVQACRCSMADAAAWVIPIQVQYIMMTHLKVPLFMMTQSALKPEHAPRKMSQIKLPALQQKFAELVLSTGIQAPQAVVICGPRQLCSAECVHLYSLAAIH